jgi:hypothetical protein
MDVRSTRGWRVRRLATAVVVWGGVGVVGAEEPGTFPLTPSTSPPPLEIYYGTKKVSPVPQPIIPHQPVIPPQPAPLELVAPATAKEGPSYHEPARPGVALVETLHAVRDGTASVSAAAVNLLGKIGTRVLMPPEPQHIVLASYAAPVPYPAPGPNSVPTPAPSTPTLPAPTVAPPTATTQPTVVVIREPAAEPRPSEPARGLSVGVDSLVAIGLGALGLVFGLVSWVRGSRRELPVAIPTPPAPVAPPAPPDTGVKLLGMYHAGPLPDTAEKFDLGPTYHEELQQKKQIEVANNQAAVEFILSQNLALLAAIDSAPAVDPAGLTVPNDDPAAVSGAIVAVEELPSA